MPNFKWFTEDAYKSERNPNPTLDRVYIEETYSLDSNLDTDSMISYLSNPIEARSIESLNNETLYETVDPWVQTQNNNKPSNLIDNPIDKVGNTPNTIHIPVNTIDNLICEVASTPIDITDETVGETTNVHKEKLENLSSNSGATSVFPTDTKEFISYKRKDKNVLKELTTDTEKDELSNYFSTTQVFSNIKSFKTIKSRNNNDDCEGKYEQQTKTNHLNKKQKLNKSKTNFTIATTTNEYDMNKKNSKLLLSVVENGVSSQQEITKREEGETSKSNSEYNQEKSSVTLSSSTVVDDLTYVRCDQFNKVSPFDGVPGFGDQSARSSLKSKKIIKSKDKITNNMLAAPAHPKLLKSISAESSTIAAKRDDWIQFSDNNGVRRSSSCEEKSLSPSEKSWIRFEDGLIKPQNKSTLDYSDIFDQAQHSQNEKEYLIETKNSEEKFITKTASVENLLSVVNQTVILLKGSITNPHNKKVEEEETLFKDTENDRNSDSDLSDIVSLDYESEEENRKLRDTPVKQFTDVSLFQAVSAVKNELKKTILSTGNVSSSSNIDILSEELQKPLHEYPEALNKKSWSFWLRYPERKKRIGKRTWLPVTVTIDGKSLRVEGHTNQGLEIYREIPLHPFFAFTIPVLHSGNKDGRMRSMKLQYVRYRETRKMKTSITIEHTAIYTPVLKLASRDTTSLREVTEKVDSIIRRIPTDRGKGITYRHEEIFIDCDDYCQFLVKGDGDLLKYNITTQIHLRVFITGSPELKLFLNDISCKEILSKTKEKLLRETKTSLNWIKPEKLEYHPCVDVQKCENEGGIVFTPPDSCSFELLRYRLRRKNKIPLIVKSSLELLTGNSVRLQASIKVVGDAKSLRHKRNDVVMYFPIPSSWSTLFVRSRSFKGTKKYIKTNVHAKTAAIATATLNRVTLQVSCGRAKYEPAYGSIVWRLGVLPIIQDGIPADATHTFQCFLELPFPLEIRDEFQPYSYVEFNIAHPLASGTSVEEILLSDGRVPNKWICYRANYSYKILMTLLENGKIRE